MKKKYGLCFSVLICLSAMVFTTCDYFGTIRGVISGVRYSVRVDNQSAGRSARSALSSDDIVELYIREYSYLYDHENFGSGDYGVLAMISDGKIYYDDNGERKYIRNAGWYSVEETNLNIKTGICNDTCSLFWLNVTKLRVNGKEYEFPSI